MKRKLPYLTLPLIVFLVACRQTSDETLKTELKTAVSWAASAQLAGEEWKKDAVPNAYALRTLETAEKNLRETVENIEQTKEISADRKAPVTKQINDLRQTLGEIQTVVERGDKTSLSQSLERLNQQKEKLAEFAKSGGDGER